SRRAYDHQLFAIARIPFKEELFYHAADALARVIRLVSQPARKVLVVDADNTLWGGVVGEDGPDGVDLSDNGAGEAYRNFQLFLLDLRRAGMLIALCSKNEPEDIWSVFARREMRLKKEHLATYQIGWQAKSQALLAIAEELNLAVNSLIFIDDNPVEIAE